MIKFKIKFLESKKSKYNKIIITLKKIIKYLLENNVFFFYKTKILCLYLENDFFLV